MFGISYGELFLIIGATAALIGPKDLPKIARTVGRLTGKAIGYVQLARGQFDNVMQQSQASQVHKELQETIAQLEAIRYEIRSISIINPAPFTRRLDGQQPWDTNGSDAAAKQAAELKPVTLPKDLKAENSVSSSLYSQAMMYAKLAESPSTKSETDGQAELSGDGLPAVLPVSADSAGLLPKRTGEAKGSDLMLQAILEAEVASKAKEFFSQPHNQISQNEK